MRHPIIAYFVFLGLNQILSLELCQKSSPWRLGNYSFYKSPQNHVKLIALLKSSCGFCKKQAQKYIFIYWP